MAASIDGPKAAGEDPLTANFVFTDLGETHVLNVENGVLHHWLRPADPAAAVRVNLTKPLFLKLVTGEAKLRELVMSDELDVEGSRLALLIRDR